MYEAALLFAIAGIVITRLQEPGEILGFIPDQFKYDSVLKKLITCAKCLSGQLALWVLSINGIVNLSGWLYWQSAAITVILSIFFAMILTLIIDRIE